MHLWTMMFPLNQGFQRKSGWFPGTLQLSDITSQTSAKWIWFLFWDVRLVFISYAHPPMRTLGRLHLLEILSVNFAVSPNLVTACQNQTNCGVPVLHSLKLTWHLKMMVSKRNLLFHNSIFRFYVTFREGTSQVKPRHDRAIPNMSRIYRHVCRKRQEMWPPGFASSLMDWP